MECTDYEINQAAERDTAEERRIEKRAQEEEEFTLYLASLLLSLHHDCASF